MNGAGFFLAVAGAWVLSQVLAGDAIGRLGIFGGTKNTARKTSGLFGIPDIPLIPQGPVTGIPFSPISFTHPATPVVA